MPIVTDFLLQTKLRPPSLRSQLVARERLWARLDAGREGRLCLIAAPAGFGKTTLAASWLQQTDGQKAWLTLDERDNDPVSFLRYFVATMQRALPNLDSQIDALLSTQQVASGTLEPTPIMALLSNHLAERETPFVLILDDFHYITDHSILDGLQFFLDHLPGTAHILLTSRTVPPLSLARMRARGQLNEISATDLRFDGDEIDAFLQSVMGLVLSPDLLRLLEARTEGWAASLQLAGLSLQQQQDAGAFVATFSGQDQQVVAYLLEEVLAGQSAEIREFLLATSFLPRLTASLCNEVTGRSDSHALLTHIQQHNLFLESLDSRGEWYRYHQLFAEFLQSQLQREAPDRAREISQIASDWLAGEGYIVEAIDVALAAENFDQAAGYIATEATPMLWADGRVNTVISWIERLPEPLWASRPDIITAYAWALFVGGRLPQVDRLLQGLAVSAEAAAPDLPAWLPYYHLVAGEYAIYCRDIERARTHFAVAKRQMPQDDVSGRAIVGQGLGYTHRLNGNLMAAEMELKAASHLFRQSGNSASLQFALYDLAETRFMQGRLQDATAIYQEMMSLIGPSLAQSMPTVCGAYVGLAHIRREQNDLESATLLLAQGQALARENFAGYLRLAQLRQALLLQAQGKGDEALSVIARAVPVAVETGSAWIVARTRMWQARLQLLLGRVTDVQSWAEEIGTPSAHRDTLPPYLLHQEQLVLARYRIARDEMAEAEALLQTLAAQAAEHDWGLNRIECDILLALVAWGSGRKNKALNRLRAALKRAEPEKIIRLFIENGAPMAAMLRAAVGRGEQTAFIGALQASFLPTVVEADLLPEPLTSRETRVLQLMAAGLVNREIADELVVAIGTIAKYSNNIYTKLQVRNRTEAITKARHLNLL